MSIVLVDGILSDIVGSDASHGSANFDLFMRFHTLTHNADILPTPSTISDILFNRLKIISCGLAFGMLAACAAPSPKDIEEFAHFRSIGLSEHHREFLTRQQGVLLLPEAVSIASTGAIKSKSLSIKDTSVATVAQHSASADGALIREVTTGSTANGSKTSSTRSLSLCGLITLVELSDRSSFFGANSRFAYQRRTVTQLTSSGGTACKPEPGVAFKIFAKGEIEYARTGQIVREPELDGMITSYNTNLACTVSDRQPVPGELIREYKGDVLKVVCQVNTSTPDAATNHYLYLVDYGFYIMTSFNNPQMDVESRFVVCAPGETVMPGTCLPVPLSKK
ncbi:MAG: hypothetical protein WBD51_13390 [Burkholderiaceae bacterium]